MFDLGWSELLVIGIVALIVVGPKDLPGMFRTVGNFIGKAKSMAREFSRAMNDAADQAGVNDVTDTLKKATNPMSGAVDEVKKATSFTQQTMESGKPKDGASTLSPERQAQAEKIREKAAQKATERKAAEAAAETSAAAKPVAASKPKAAAGGAAAKKPVAAKKPAAKKPAAKKSTAKKPSEGKA